MTAGALTVANLLVNVGADLGDLNKGFAQANSTVEGFAGRLSSTSAMIGKLFVGASIAGITALGAGFGAATSAAMEFEKTLSGVRAVSGATATQMKSLSDLALQLGADTSFSATEAAQGIEELVKAGVSMADVMGGAAKASLDLAAAGGISVADAATIASNAMNQFSIKGSDMAGVADLIAGAANASAIDVGQFKYSLQAVGAVAATVGLSFKDTATSIAVLGQAGIVGSDAGTSLKTMLLGLQPQTKEQTKLFQQLGLMTKDGANAFFDASGKVKSMADVAQILQKALKGQTEQQKLATLQTLFGSDAIRAAAVFARSGADGFREMAKAMGEVSAADVAETRLDNLGGSLEKLTGSLSTVAITVGSQLTPKLRSLVDYATSTVNNWAPTISLFAARVPTAIEETGKALTDLLDILLGGDSFDAAFERLSNLFPESVAMMIVDGVEMVGKAVRWLGTDAWPLLTGAVGVFSAYVRDVFIPVIGAAWDWLAPKLSGALTWLTNTGWPKLTGVIGTFGAWVQGTGIPRMRDLYDWLGAKIGAALSWLAVTGWPGLLAAGTTAWTWITGTLVPALSSWWAWLSEKISPIYSWFIDYGWPMLQSAGMTAVTWITESLLPILSEWWTWFQGRLSPIYSWFIDYAWPALQSAGAAFWSWLTESLIPQLTEWWWWLEEKLQPAATWFIDEGFPGLKDWGKKVSDTIDSLNSTWKDFNDQLSRTDTAESWVTILENLGKFGHYLLTKIDLAGWFSSIGSGASAANGEVGYMAQAIAWISRTLAKWSAWLPGVDAPSIDEPPKRSSGGGGSSGGGSSGGNSSIDAPPARSSGGGSGGSVIPNPYPSTGGSSGGGGGSSGGGGGSGGSSGGGAGTGSGGGYSGSNFDMSSRQAMIASAKAMADSLGLGLPGDIVAAIPIQEAGFPGTTLGRQYHNWWSIKATRDWTGKTVDMGNVWEVIDGKNVMVPATWRAYGSDKEAMLDFRNFLQENSRYAGALSYWQSTGDPVGFIKRVNQAGYATDPTWADKVLNIAGYAKGGWAGLNGPELAMLGERGPEYVVPNGGLSRMGGDTYYVTVQVNGNALASKEDIATAVVVGLQHAQRTGRTKVAVI